MGDADVEPGPATSSRRERLWGCPAGKVATSGVAVVRYAIPGLCLFTPSFPESRLTAGESSAQFGRRAGRQLLRPDSSRNFLCGFLRTPLFHLRNGSSSDWT